MSSYWYLSSIISRMKALHKWLNWLQNLISCQIGVQFKTCCDNEITAVCFSGETISEKAGDFLNLHSIFIAVWKETLRYQASYLRFFFCTDTVAIHFPFPVSKLSQCAIRRGFHLPRRRQVQESGPDDHSAVQGLCCNLI